MGGVGGSGEDGWQGVLFGVFGIAFAEGVSHGREYYNEWNVYINNVTL